MTQSSGTPHRREFLRTAAQTAALGGLAGWSTPSASAALQSAATTTTASRSGKARKRVALIGTIDRTMSHAQHFLDRMILGYNWQGGWHTPEVDLTAIYLDQFPKDDLGRARAKRHGIPLYPTIEDALTGGTGKLNVDGVVIIGEHGDYPRNDKGQTLYPRYEFFQKVVEVFRDSGRGVPVFNDKHLSTTWERCTAMVNAARELNFPFFAGSSLPVTSRLPAVDMPHGADLVESVCVGYGGVDSYDFHGLETAQCMSERRRGGEVGIARVRALRDQAMWDHLAERPVTQRLFLAALSRSHFLPVTNGYHIGPVTLDWARTHLSTGYSYFIEHQDGFLTNLFMLPIHDFNYAGFISSKDTVISCQMYLPMPSNAATTANFFNPLIHHIEQMVKTSRTPYPVERTLLTSGMTMAAVESLHRKGAWVETPEMKVAYQVGPESTFQRE